MSFRSVPSKSLQITVVAASSSSVVLGVVIGLVVLLLVLGIGYFVWRRRLQGVGTMVLFSNTFGGEIKHDEEDRSNKIFNGRDPDVQVKEHGQSRGLDDKKTNGDQDNSVERVPEDLAGRVCYELEPLVVT